MPKWSVTLNGDRADLKALADLGVGVTEEGDAFVFRSPDLDGLTDALAVHQHAVEQVEVFNGLSRMAACDQKVRVYAWQINAHGYQGASPASDLKFFIGRQPSKRSRKRDLQWFPQREAKTLLEACRELKPRWHAFLMVGFCGGLRWGEIAGLLKSDIDWSRQRVHVQRTWSEDGGRIEPWTVRIAG